MPRDYENVHRIQDMDDQELEDLIVQELGEYPDVDVDDVEVRVERGFVTLAGRVGTEYELQLISHVVTDVLGIQSCSNEILIDEARRAQLPEAADEEVAVEGASMSQIGGSDAQASDTSEHLMEHLHEELYSTHDLQRAIQEGLSYEAPDQPLQEGYWSEESH